MKLTLNKFLIIFFLLTSVCPILGLGFLHINYLHQILNENKSFLTLIEHEEFNLFLIYSGIVIIAMTSCLIIFRNLLLEPFNNVAAKLKTLSQAENTDSIKNSKKYLHEIQIFINEFNKAVNTMKVVRQQRNDFIATLTHDLRVPLIAEQKAFKLLMDYSLDDATRSKLMNSLIHSNEDLLKLVNNLFDRYSSGNKLGTGLGLYISKLIIEAHSAQIFAKNKSPRGVEFIISLPIDTAEIKP